MLRLTDTLLYIYTCAKHFGMEKFKLYKPVTVSTKILS